MPEPTSEWKPDIAPQATMTKSIGHMSAFVRPNQFISGANIGTAPLSIEPPNIIPIAPIAAAKYRKYEAR